MKTYILLLSVALSGCAASMIGGNKYGVTFDRVKFHNAAETMQRAERHCSQYGRSSVVSHDSGRSMTFRCIKGD